MQMMKCASCDAVLERTDMPHHIREHHLLPNRHAPRVPRPTVSFGEWQARASTRPAPVITRPQRDTFRSEIEDIVHAFVALPDQLRQACGEGVEKLPVLGVSPSALQQSVGVMIYAAIRRCMRTPSRTFNYALQRNKGRGRILEPVF